MRAPWADQVGMSANAADRYQFLAKLGSGGMADVYLAVQRGEEQFERLVVVKRIHAGHTDDESTLTMFLDEARTVASLNHPNIVKIFNLSRVEDELCIAMEYVDGESLAYTLSALRKADRPFSLRVLFKLILDAADALAYAHRATSADGTPLELVHRDVTPANLVLDKNGYLKVIDFGIAKTAIQTELTSPGGIKGKFSYLSPESFYERSVDARADVYSLGLVLFECLTLRRALNLKDAPMKEVMEKVQTLQLPNPSEEREEIPEALDDIVHMACAREPGERYANMADFAKALRDVAEGCGGVASAAEVQNWFSVTFEKRLARRRAFEREALARGKAAAERADDEASLSLRTARLDTQSTHNTGMHTEPVTRTAYATPTKRANPYLLLAFLFLLFSGAAFLVRALFFDSDPAPVAEVAPPPIAQDNLIVIAEPADATVFVDDKRMGVAGADGLALHIEAHSQHTIRIERDGYQSQQTTVRGVASGVERLNIQLAKVPPPPPAPAAEAAEAEVTPNEKAVTVSKPTSSSAAKRYRSRRATKRKPSVAAKPVAPVPTTTPAVEVDKEPVVEDKKVEKPAIAEAKPTGATADKPTESKTQTQSASSSATATSAKTAAPPPAAQPKPKAKPKTPEKKWYSKSGNWSGERVVEKGCTQCHNGKKAAKVSAADKSPRQWKRFFSRDTHKRWGHLDTHFSDGEQKRALEYLLERQKATRRRGVAGVR